MPGLLAWSHPTVHGALARLRLLGIDVEEEDRLDTWMGDSASHAQILLALAVEVIPLTLARPRLLGTDMEKDRLDTWMGDSGSPVPKGMLEDWPMH